MLNRNNSSFFICLVASVVIHFLFFFMFFYHRQNEQVFLQVPIEVSFYSPVQDFRNKSVAKIEQPVNKIENKVEDKIEKKAEPKKETEKKEIKEVKENKEDISLNAKKEEKKKEEPVKEEVDSKEQVQEEQGEQTQSQSVPSFMPNKGIMLENEDFKYSYYTNSIVKKISRYWQWANSYSSYRTVVYFRIERDGFVKTVEIKESSGNEGFDENAVRAIQLASPFAPLPDGYAQEHLGVYFEFKYR